jgi:exo-beta-1,3-glucanase (GH17 family)
MSLRFASLSLAFAIAACSSSTPSPDAPGDSGGVPEAGDDGGRRDIPDEVLARRGIAYSGYRKNQSPNVLVYPTEAQIKEDLQLLLRGGWSYLRLFDCSRHAELVLKVIRDNSFDIKVQLGVWIAGAKARTGTKNQDQIEACMALDATYSDIIAAVSIGNETLDEWSSVRVPVPELVDYITQVRSRVRHPVTTDDMYIPFMFGNTGTTSYADVVDVARAVDFLSIHAYAFIDAPWSWDWKQLAVPEGHDRAVAMMKAALTYTQACIHNVRSALLSKGLDRPIVIGEAGWKTLNANLADKDAHFRAHPVNQKMFYDAFTSWVYGNAKDANSPRTAFYFEAFDEPWKSEDDNWGLFDVNRQAKYVMWDKFPELKPADAPAYTDDDAVYYIAPPPIDAGDAGDAGADDATASDADASEADALDAGAPDAAATDADAGEAGAVDAGAPDAMESDGGAIEAGPGADGSAPTDGGQGSD